MSKPKIQSTNNHCLVFLFVDLNKKHRHITKVLVALSIECDLINVKRWRLQLLCELRVEIATAAIAEKYNVGNVRMAPFSSTLAD